MPRKPTPRKRTLQELYKAVWDKAIKDGWLKLKFSNSQEMHRARFVLYNVIKAEDKAGNHLFAAAARGHSIRYDPESPRTTLIISSRVKDSINDVFESVLDEAEAPRERVLADEASLDEASTRARAPAQAHTPARVSQQREMTAADREEFEQAERSQALLMELLGGGGKAPKPELETKKQQEPGKPRVTPYYTRG